MPSAENLNRAEWEVRDVELVVCQAFVHDLHYSAGGSNTATARHGLFRKGEPRCWGVAWWIPPTKGAALATYPDNWRGVLALSRLAIEPTAPRNSASFLLSQSRRRIDRTTWPCLVTYADEWRGHSGAIYLADNWEFMGRTKPERVYVRNGRMLARKAGARTRTHQQMIDLGAECVGSFAKRKFRHVVTNA